MVTAKELKEELISCLRLEDITADEIEDGEALFGEEGLGLDSVDSIELVLALERVYGIKLDNSKEYDTIFVSIQSLLDFINANKK